MVNPPRVVGVCTLTTRGLAERLRFAPGVAIAGPLMTANLGIEELVRSVLRERSIRVLLVCGRDSPLFMQGQSLAALVRHGVRKADRRIVGAAGHRPFLRGLRPSDVDAFRSRVRLVDLRGVLDSGRLRTEIADQARCAEDCSTAPILDPAAPRFTALRPGGRREPIAKAGEGFFVVSVDSPRREVVLRHYRDDLGAGHEMRGRRGESMVLGLVQAGLVTDPGHAAYLGAELVKAETAVRLGLDYVQDIPLRRPALAAFAARPEETMQALRSLDDFTSYLAKLLDAAGSPLSPDVSIGEQTAADSVRMIELAIALEQECGMDLPDDVDLRAATPAELFDAASVRGARP